jgi:hypothetical protein
MESNEDEESRHTNVTWHASTFTAHHVLTSGDTGAHFGPNEMLLDNQSDVSVMKPALLRQIVPAEKEIDVIGAGWGVVYGA